MDENELTQKHKTCGELTSEICRAKSKRDYLANPATIEESSIYNENMKSRNKLKDELYDELTSGDYMILKRGEESRKDNISKCICIEYRKNYKLMSVYLVHKDNIDNIKVSKKFDGDKNKIRNIYHVYGIY